MALATLFIGWAVLSVNDVLPEYGWDGNIYGRIAEKGPFRFLADRHGNMDPYYVRRMLPPWVVYHALVLFDVPRVMKNVIVAYQLLNLAVLVAASLCWGRIASFLRLSTGGGWVGWGALFLCAANAKLPYFYPALTDTSACALGVFSLWAYVRRNHVALFVLTAIAGFCWPSAPLLGMILFVLPREELDVSAPAPRFLPATAAALAFAATLAGCVYVHWIRDWDRNTGAELLGTLAPLSTLVAAAMAGASTYVLLDRRATWRPRLALGLLARVPLAAALLYAIGWAIAQVAWGTPKITTERFVLEILWHAILAPGQAIVAHTVYFGPIFVLLLLRLRRVGRLAQAYGPGMVLVMLLTAAQLLHPESRRVINVLPFLVVLVVQALDEDEELTTPAVLVFLGLALLYSRAWDRFDVPNKEDWRVYVYFMTQGPWLRMTMWVAQGLGVIMTTATFALVLPRRRAPA
jgi:hypothetical protein